MIKMLSDGLLRDDWNICVGCRWGSVYKAQFPIRVFTKSLTQGALFLLGGGARSHDLKG